MQHIIMKLSTQHVKSLAAKLLIKLIYRDGLISFSNNWMLEYENIWNFVSFRYYIDTVTMYSFYKDVKRKHYYSESNTGTIKKIGSNGVDIIQNSDCHHGTSLNYEKINCTK